LGLVGGDHLAGRDRDLVDAADDGPGQGANERDDDGQDDGSRQRWRRRVEDLERGRKKLALERGAGGGGELVARSPGRPENAHIATYEGSCAHGLARLHGMEPGVAAFRLLEELGVGALLDDLALVDEQGTHAELLKQPEGRYARLHAMQA